MELSNEAARALRELELAHGGPARHAERVLVLVRRERSVPLALTRQLEGDDLEIISVPGQVELTDLLPDDQPLPLQAIEHIVQWITKTLPEAGTDYLKFVGTSDSLELAEGSIVERPVRIGQLDLFGIVTEPVNRSGLPTLVFLNAGLLHHIGPGRFWVDLARDLAGYGFRSLRIDLAGLGESPERPGHARQIAYPIEAVDDVSAVLEWLSDSADVVLLGLCSGAYHSAEAGIALRPRGAVLINPVLTFVPPDVQEGATLGRRRIVAHPYHPVVDFLRRFAWVRWLGERFVPNAFWTVLDRLNLQTSPARALVELAASGVDTLLICGTMEAQPVRQRGAAQLRQLAASPLFAFHVVDEADHALFGVGARRQVANLVTQHLVEHFRSEPANVS